MQKIIIILLLSSGFIFACHKKAINDSSKKNIKTNTSNNTSSEIKNVIVDPKINMMDTGSSYNIDSMKVSADILSVFVNYSGGCKTHSFDLYSNGAYAKSLPPQTSLSLKHVSNGDACRQIITQELKFNISNLKYSGQNTVIVKLGNAAPVYYISK